MTIEKSRRDVMKLAAALAVGTGLRGAKSTRGEQPSKPASPADSGKKADDLLALANRSPEGFALSEPTIITLDAYKPGYDLIITSARDEQGNPTYVHVRSRCVRIFRASAVDEFTNDCGVYWTYRKEPGKVKLTTDPGLDAFNKSPGLGPIVMVVRDEESVRFYAMTLDFRC
jgi:hypothetical protein